VELLEPGPARDCVFTDLATSRGVEAAVLSRGKAGNRWHRDCNMWSCGVESAAEYVRGKVKASRAGLNVVTKRGVTRNFADGFPIRGTKPLKKGKRGSKEGIAGTTKRKCGGWRAVRNGSRDSFISTSQAVKSRGVE